MTRICIFGAGAIGGYVGAALHEAGAEVSLVARGPHLEAIRADGLGLEKDGKVTRSSLPARWITWNRQYAQKYIALNEVRPTKHRNHR